jgi:hypothetical protein
VDLLSHEPPERGLQRGPCDSMMLRRPRACRSLAIRQRGHHRALRSAHAVPDGVVNVARLVQRAVEGHGRRVGRVVAALREVE